MSINKKTHKQIINIVLIIGFILFCVGLYQIGTVTFLSTKMRNIEDTWVTTGDNETRGYYGSYKNNYMVKIIDKIGYRDTIDNAIINPPADYKENVDLFEDLKEKGYRYIYQFYNSGILLAAEDYYQVIDSYDYYKSHDESYSIKLHDWVLGNEQYWIWTLESKGEPPLTTIVYSIPILLLGLVIFIISGLTRLRYKVYLGKIRVPGWIQKKLVDGERVIAKAGMIYLTDKRLIKGNRLDFKFLYYNQITEITYEKYGIGRPIVFTFLLSLFSLIYIIIVPDMLGYPYQIGDVWVNPISSMFATESTRLVYQFTLIVVGFVMGVMIFSFSFRYFQVKAPGFDKKLLRYWRIDVPTGLHGHIHNFIEIVKGELMKNSNRDYR